MLLGCVEGIFHHPTNDLLAFFKLKISGPCWSPCCCNFISYFAIWEQDALSSLLSTRDYSEFLQFLAWRRTLRACRTSSKERPAFQAWRLSMGSYGIHKLFPSLPSSSTVRHTEKQHVKKKGMNHELQPHYLICWHCFSPKMLQRLTKYARLTKQGAGMKNVFSSFIYTAILVAATTPLMSQ